MATRGARRPFGAWARLLRLPNLLTVPGDPLAGAWLAAGARDGAAPAGPAAAAVGAALALYGFGLVLNDLTDRAEDARERPERPLPSGAVVPGAARLAAALLAGIGLLCAALAGRGAAAAGVALFGAIVLYNRWAKTTAAGPWVMGACRAGSLWMGAAAAGPAGFAAPAAAGALGLYVAAVTCAARGETATARARRAADPAVLALGGIALGLLLAAPADPALWLLAAPPLLLALAAARRWRAAGPGRGPEAIGRLLGALPFLQAGAVRASGAAGASPLAAALALAGLLNWAARRRIPAS